MDNQKITRLEQIEDDSYYRVGDLQAILKNLGLYFSIFTIRDYENYTCLNYRCGKRYKDKTVVCDACGSDVRKPLIDSPRTGGGARGTGHRRYLGTEIKEIVKVFKQRH